MKKYKVVSHSMVPVIGVGAELFLEQVHLDQLKRFDIIVFQDGPAYTCHYIWHINRHIDKGLITTRNLDGYHFDEPFHFDKVIGKVTNFEIPLWIRLKLLFWIR